MQAMGRFFFVLLVKEQGLGRSRQILWVTKWLYYWWCWQGFDFRDQGTLFKYQGVMGRGGIHLTKRSESIFGKRLANLLRGAFN